MKFPSVLRVAVVAQMGIFKINTTEKNHIQIIGGWESKFLQMLADGLKFQYTTIIPNDNEWGRLSGNGSWSGAIGTVARNEADIAIGNIGLYIERLSVVDFAYPHHIEDFIFATKPPGILPRENAIYLPFSTPLWITLLVMVITLTISFKLLLNQRHTFQDIIFYILGTLLFAHSSIKTKSAREKILIASWLLGSMVISLSYMGLILAFLTIPLKEQPVTNKYELLQAVRKGTYKCIAQTSGFILNLLLNSGDETIASLGKEIAKNNWIVFTSENETQDTMRQRKVALIASKSAFLSVQEKVLSEDVFFSILSGIAVNKQFCCKKALDLVIHRITAAGLYSKSKEFFFLKRLLKSRQYSDQEREAFAPLQAQDLSGAILLLFSGHIIGILCFVAEVLFKKMGTNL